MFPLRAVFLTRRAFLAGWSVVLVLVLGWFWAPALIAGKLAVLALVLLIAADLYVLFGDRTGITAQRRTLERWSNGDVNPVTIQLKSEYGIDMRVRVLDELPFQFQKRDLVFSAAIPAWGRREFDYTVRPVQRGVYRYGAIQAYVSSDLGFVERRFSLEAAKEVAVYPSYLQLRKYELLAISDRLTLAGIKRVRRVAQHAEFERIKEYVPGDDRRTVNWKATARRGRMMVNQYQDERAQQVFALIDTGRVMKMPFEGLSLLDHAINASLVISSIAMRKEDRAGLITFSDKVHDVLAASRQRGQMQKIMQVLHAQGTDHRETDIEALFGAVRRNIHQRSLLLLFTNFESVNALKRQLPYLQRLARQHLVVPIFFLNTELDKDLKQRPSNTEDLYIHTLTERAVHEKRLIARELERSGLPAILCKPEDLTVNVINRYLQIKARGTL
ncbi:MAG TPA: DUF58 domain-containing protein [Flavobacteriales bacterium]|nr:DUF58 domain-containing protein [Flavobacteriales bacterium]